MTEPTAATYQSAGVDLDLYQQSMAKLPRLIAETHRAHAGRVMDLPGGFAGLFRLNAGGKSYSDPVLVSGTDGVGTKLKVATRCGKYDTVGMDLVAMCVNDCLCLGAEPLFFLDYLALPADDPERVEQLVRGVSTGCVQAECALLGGETAIMPAVYSAEEFDMAGFCVGVVERDAILDGSAIEAGDVLIGLESTGLHSNGFSLVRKIVFDIAGLDADSHIPELGRTVGEELLEPTRIYSKTLASLRSTLEWNAVHGIAHITGGGLEENVTRILPAGVSVAVDNAAWEPQPIFDWLQQLGNVTDDEMARVFNMGMGMVVVVAGDAADALINAAVESGCPGRVIGSVSGS